MGSMVAISKNFMFELFDVKNDSIQSCFFSNWKMEDGTTTFFLFLYLPPKAEILIMHTVRRKTIQETPYTIWYY